jgi:hypothetical protein
MKVLALIICLFLTQQVFAAGKTGRSLSRSKSPASKSSGDKTGKTGTTVKGSSRSKDAMKHSIEGFSSMDDNDAEHFGTLLRDYIIEKVEEHRNFRESDSRSKDFHDMDRGNDDANRTSEGMRTA